MPREGVAARIKVRGRGFDILSSCCAFAVSDFVLVVEEAEAETEGGGSFGADTGSELGTGALGVVVFGVINEVNGVDVDVDGSAEFEEEVMFPSFIHQLTVLSCL